ncbi:hypothetical protein SCLCIDRAFT_860312 [Scleroderma citrinum Foug A]|uniref:Uncharacterized protein n=1 Tax=Scleroderma citrinum Foug A TaxID=1036808 RepID=A0A0C3AAE2_9AGAM|nr:hypothetical protein SCLCIDRAFT_860312 [Scleroderma citrinum Foug A]
MGFLAIQSVDSAPGGLSYLPQRFSYLSLISALSSIVMGSAVRSPRLFTNRGPFYFYAVILTLVSPFAVFLYSVLLFLLALLIHCANHNAMVQLVFAGSLIALLSCCFFNLLPDHGALQ